MIKVIQEFAVPAPKSGEDIVKIPMHKGAKILKVGTLFDNPHVWAIVDPTVGNEIRKFRIIQDSDTEFEEKELGNYLGSFTMQEGHLIGHVFEV